MINICARCPSCGHTHRVDMIPLFKITGTCGKVMDRVRSML